MGETEGFHTLSDLSEVAKMTESRDETGWRTDMETARAGAALMTPQGETIELSDAEFEVLSNELDQFRSRRDGDRLITTGEAAELLGVSPRTVCRLVDKGEIPAVRYGERASRRLLESDVLDYRRSSRRRMRQGLTEAVRIAEDGGLYDIDFSDDIAEMR